ncbi:cysteine protease [Brachybacterium endophyticum]|uniref:Cysteine protease n=1 Tax=Brachybacterium endophyticum TaxID=2182385 RepID=A0A2U2RGN9_9MICO|nr:transglutaminase domain-containing protein [Brachybacterium endophyticum]PWH05039.1 cysteine protease [Brachybacterium endophyticum]
MSPRETRPGAPVRTAGEVAADAGVLAVLFVLALLGYHSVFGGPWYLVTGLMALILSAGIALAGARWRFGPLLLTLALVIVHFLLGSAFAVPARARWGALPTPASLLDLLRMPVTTWKSALTMSPPIGIGDGVLGVVWLPMLLLVVAGFSVLLRTRHYALAWLFPCGMLACSIVFGTTTATLPLLRGLLFAALSLAWLSWRFESARLRDSRSTIISDTVRPGSWHNPVLRRRVIGGGVILLLSAGLTAAASPTLDPPAGTARFALRDTMTPQFDPRQYVSPLADFRGYIKHRREEKLFTVDGISNGDSVRLATLDDYNLQVYDVAGSSDARSPSGAFLKVAGDVDLSEPSSRAKSATVTVDGYSGVWMPTVGTGTDRVDPKDAASQDAGGSSIGDTLFLNRRSQTLVDSSGLRQGDSYTLRYEPYKAADDEQQHSMRFAGDVAESLPRTEGLDPHLKSQAQEWAEGAPTDYETMQNLLLGIQAEAEYSHGIDDEQASLSGHGQARLLAMLNEPSFDRSEADAAPQGKIGDEEQFAVLTAVMAREIGIPARVVMGFDVDEAEHGTATVTGDDVTAWVEVAFQEPGSSAIHWERFDPAPDKDNNLTQPEKKTTDKPQPQVPQPPPPPAEPPTPPPGAIAEDQPDPPDPDEPASLWVGFTSGIGLLVLLAAATLGVIAGAKTMRRRDRRWRGAPGDRVDGGWRELVDLHLDLGHTPATRATRRETARHIGEALPGEGDGPDGTTREQAAEQVDRLAAGADRATFAPEVPAESDLEAYWAGVMESRRRMTAGLPWHRRLLATASLRSFRAHGREAGQERRGRRAGAARSARAGYGSSSDGPAAIAAVRGAVGRATGAVRSGLDRGAGSLRSRRERRAARCRGGDRG